MYYKGSSKTRSFNDMIKYTDTLGDTDIMEYIEVDEQLIWFDKYNRLLEPWRNKTLLLALYIAKNRNLTHIVETGTTRKEGFNMDGQATSLFGDYCHTLLNGNGKIWTCDINKNNIDMCKQITEEYKSYITYVVDDSLNFLEKFDDRIDFLYLDSFDATEGKSEEASQHNLKEIKIALPKLHKDSVVVIDDYHMGENTGKGMYSVPYLKENGWRTLNTTGYQAVLIKK